MNKYTVIGNPISHSLSPLIHQLFAEQTNQKIHYFPTLAPLDQFSETLNTFQKEGGCGANITLPFKQIAIQCVDILTPRASEAGVINTIKFNLDGSRSGDNTDGLGLIRDIRDNLGFSIYKKKVLILGAGGAVQGILDALIKEAPEEIVIANRTEQRAIQLVKKFAKKAPLRACSLLDLKGYKFDLIINGTSASLHGKEINLPNTLLNSSALCYDLVYGSTLTTFLKWAKLNDAAIIADGLGMLIEQAAESFYIWLGVMPNTLLLSPTIRNKAYQN